MTVNAFRTPDRVCTDGSTMIIPTSSIPIFMEEVNIVGDPRVLTYLNRNLPYMNLLKVRVPDIGDIWIDSTLEEFNDLIGSANLNPWGDDSLLYTIGTDTPAGNYIIDPRLYNKKIVSITVNGPAVYNVGYTSNALSTPKTGILDFTAAGTLTDGTIVQVTYKNI